MDMACINNRKLPAGIQSFKKVREEGYLYVDKSDIVWHLANCGKMFNYLSRPRRFGKSMLVNTLQMYLEGRKELFNWLKIMQLEKDWKQHPVIRLDLSLGGASADTLRSYLDIRFDEYEKKFGIVPKATAKLADRFNAIGLKVEVERMIATGRIDMIVQSSRYIYIIELKLRNNGGKAAAAQQILDRQYMEPFKADKRQVIGIGIELDEEGKGLLDYKFNNAWNL